MEQETVSSEDKKRWSIAVGPKSYTYQTRTNWVVSVRELVEKYTVHDKRHFILKTLRFQTHM